MDPNMMKFSFLLFSLSLWTLTVISTWSVILKYRNKKNELRQKTPWYKLKEYGGRI